MRPFLLLCTAIIFVGGISFFTYKALHQKNNENSALSKDAADNGDFSHQLATIQNKIDALENEKDIVDLANSMRYTHPHVRAVVTSKEFSFIFPDSKSITVPMPEDEFLLSIAPYIEETHKCYNHVFSSCTGELFGEDISVRVEAGGLILLDKTVRTNKNGFFDLWVPRKENVQVTVSYNGKSSKEVLDADDEDRTCITTMQLI